MAQRSAVVFYLLVLQLVLSQSTEKLNDYKFNGKDVGDYIQCPESCMCSVGALSDLVVQCNGYQNNQKNSLLPYFSKDTEAFVTRLDLIDSKIPILSDNFLNKERSYSKLLRSLRIQKSGIKTIQSKAFKLAKNLEEIELEENNLNELPIDVFSSSMLPNLRMLSLRRNYNLNLPELGPWLKSHTIQELDASFCGITGVYIHSFSRLPILTYLNLANNNIDFLHPEAFAKLHYLEELNLSNNKIINVPSKFSSSLQTLSLQNNPEFNINSLINLSPNVAISELDLSQCNINTLPREIFSQLHGLVNLNLSHNALTDLYFPFVLRQLHYLDLSYNKLKGPLNENLFGSCSVLETLRLAWNHGLELPVPGFQGDLKSIYLLDISGCDIKSLPSSSINIFTGLAYLNLSHNEISLSDDLFQSFLDLNSLDLSFNKLNEIPPNIFNKNSKLKYLSLASNENVNNISLILENNLLLKTLDIARCNLQDMPEFLPQNIESLIIDNNKIDDPTMLTKLIAQSLLSLRTISITHNQWKCNFDFKQLIGTLRERQIFDDGMNGSWSDYQAHVCLQEKMTWDEFKQTSLLLPREVLKSHFWSLLTFSLTLMVFVVIAGIATVAYKRRMSSNLRRNYRQLSDSSNLSTPANTPAISNKIYKEPLEPAFKPVTFSTNLFPRFPVPQNEIPEISYLSGNYHHKELDP